MDYDTKLITGMIITGTIAVILQGTGHRFIELLMFGFAVDCYLLLMWDTVRPEFKEKLENNIRGLTCPKK